MVMCVVDFGDGFLVWIVGDTDWSVEIDQWNLLLYLITSGSWILSLQKYDLSYLIAE